MGELILKRIWNIFKYVLLVILIVITINAFYLHEPRRIRDGIILILFWVSMILKQKSQEQNKFVSVVYYITSVLIVVSTILEVFFGLYI